MITISKNMIPSFPPISIVIVILFLIVLNISMSYLGKGSIVFDIHSQFDFVIKVIHLHCCFIPGNISILFIFIIVIIGCLYHIELRPTYLFRWSLRVSSSSKKLNVASYVRIWSLAMIICYLVWIILEIISLKSVNLTND